MRYVKRKKLLNEDDLSKVNGGSIDWKSFYTKFTNALVNYDGTITQKHKDLVEARKNKVFVTVAAIAIPLIAEQDPLVM